jgi:hypothetical protein
VDAQKESFGMFFLADFGMNSGLVGLRGCGAKKIFVRLAEQ